MTKEYQSRPETIWIQFDDPDHDFGALWCDHEIFDGDIPYVRADLIIGVDWAKKGTRDETTIIVREANRGDGAGAVSGRQADTAAAR